MDPHSSVAVADDVREVEAGIVVATEIEPLTRGLDQLLNDAALRNRLGANARRLVGERNHPSEVAEIELTVRVRERHPLAPARLEPAPQRRPVAPVRRMPARQTHPAS